MDRGAAGSAVWLRGTWALAGRVGFYFAPLCPPLTTACALLRFLGTKPQSRSLRAISLPWVLGRSTWDTSAWVQLPSTRRVAGSLDSVGRGLGLQKPRVFLRVFRACLHSPNYTQWHSECLTLPAP